MRLILLFVLVVLVAKLVGYLASYLSPLRSLAPVPQPVLQPLVRPAIICPPLQRVCVGGRYYDLYIAPVMDGAGQPRSCASSS
jgi:hypothetical protein